MKITIDICALDQLVVEILRDSREICLEVDKTKYAKKYAQACDLVIKHFGGAPCE